ncbi:uncharacterized protein [Rutidosis leptorrhynchoides]|uniref:uncharacterized protein n=1 Tax=Rutidosis leptorrhynchoides TaxID=125765 RepID=UPI003A98E8D7
MVDVRVTSIHVRYRTRTSRKELFVWEGARDSKKILHHMGSFLMTSIENLDKRGIDLDTVLCPFCNNEVETLKHALCDCTIAKDVWSRVSRWWNTVYVDYPCLSDRFTGSISHNGSSTSSKLWQAVEWVTGYCLWVHRNNVIFQKKKFTDPMLLNEVQIKTFEWISTVLGNII